MTTKPQAAIERPCTLHTHARYRQGRGPEGACLILEGNFGRRKEKGGREEGGGQVGWTCADCCGGGRWKRASPRGTPSCHRWPCAPRTLGCWDFRALHPRARHPMPHYHLHRPHHLPHLSCLPLSPPAASPPTARHSPVSPLHSGTAPPRERWVRWRPAAWLVPRANARAFGCAHAAPASHGTARTAPTKHLARTAAAAVLLPYGSLSRILTCLARV